MKAALVYSGTDAVAADNQDTLVQKKEIEGVLNSLKIQTLSFAFEMGFGDLERLLRHAKPDFIFNLVETVGGTDRLSYVAAALFEYLGIPYTGCPASALSILSSKTRQKELLRLARLPTPEDGNSTSGPWIVKSDTEHASKGIGADNVVESASAAKKKIEEKQTEFGGAWFTERFIEGREFNLSMLESKDGKPQVLAPAEIMFTDYPSGVPKIVDYAAKWDAESPAYNTTPRHFDFDKKDTPLLKQLNRLCCQCWDLFGLKGAARVDFRVDETGAPWILEINANPCLSADAGFMAAAKQSGLLPAEVIERLLPLSYSDCS